METTADILLRHHWFSREMTSEERAQKFRTDDALLTRLVTASDWLKTRHNKLDALPRSGQTTDLLNLNLKRIESLLEFFSLLFLFLQGRTATHENCDHPEFNQELRVPFQVKHKNYLSISSYQTVGVTSLRRYKLVERFLISSRRHQKFLVSMFFTFSF